jgi:hypothetical protein
MGRLVGWAGRHRTWGLLLLVLGADVAVVGLAILLPIRGDGCAVALQFAGSTMGEGNAAALELLKSKCSDVDVRSMLVADFAFLLVYGPALALVCRVGAKALYSGRMHTAATWAGHGAVAAAVADALENGMLLLVPNAIATGARAGNPVWLLIAQGLALI